MKQMTEISEAAYHQARVELVRRFKAAGFSEALITRIVMQEPMPERDREIFRHLEEILGIPLPADGTPQGE